MDSGKSYLIENRLSPLLKEHGVESFADFVKLAERPGMTTLHRQIVDAITVNETLFFRDKDPFRALENKIIPDLIDLRRAMGTVAPLRIWCAACSSGQEPYSVAITLAELLGDLRKWDIRILATDISDAALATASAGRYLPHEVDRGMPASKLEKYFHKRDDHWQISDEIRSLVKFQNVNLLKPFEILNKFDIVLCRNVSIYFSADDRRSLFTRMQNQLFDHGYLIVGSSEILSDLGPTFKPHRHCNATFYRPNLPGPAPAVGATSSAASAVAGTPATGSLATGSGNSILQQPLPSTVRS